ncbi:MAG TPA: [FeFe] hydrogenase H-cluster radical SAM maturase HydE [Syntrophomonadaceae bacterium]|nr:[FeFe] hydrogenase H-cluster radical SAM maturase HydE [Syntrophomonadaceae bacterium]
MHPEQILDYLLSQDQEQMQQLIKQAGQVRDAQRGRQIYLRGLIEISNQCSYDCLYCGIRNSHHHLTRYRLDRDTIIQLALFIWQQGYHSICLQSGQIDDPDWLAELVDIVAQIKIQTRQLDPEGRGLGITLSLGELSPAQYQEFFDAGAHRYLLRIESSNPDLFASIHPPHQSYDQRIECLYQLKSIGYQVGTGIMIGLPGQNAHHLLQDLDFFKQLDVDMLGMGPYIPHPDAPLYRSHKPVYLDPYLSTLKMLALCRITMPDINMVASTALQSMHPQGLQRGLEAGANVVMPVLTPDDVREQYNLYTGKKNSSGEKLLAAIRALGYEPGLYTWGDAPHYHKRLQHR